jgi:hypothetical protein
MEQAKFNANAAICRQLSTVRTKCSKFIWWCSKRYYGSFGFLSKQVLWNGITGS